MEKKGFTLVEVLAVITILGVIALITTISVIRIVNDSREKLYDKQIGTYEEQAKKWSVDNASLLEKDKTKSCCVTIDTLYKDGYLEETDLKNPRNPDKKISGGVTITYNENYQQFIYKYDNNCNNSCSK